MAKYLKLNFTNYKFRLLAQILIFNAASVLPFYFFMVVFQVRFRKYVVRRFFPTNS